VTCPGYTIKSVSKSYFSLKHVPTNFLSAYLGEYRLQMSLKHTVPEY
jgi:hypothetical protein